MERSRDELPDIAKVIDHIPLPEWYRACINAGLDIPRAHAVKALGGEVRAAGDLRHTTTDSEGERDATR